MPKRIADDIRTAVELALEAGESLSAIASEHALAVSTVYGIRQELEAVRQRAGLEPLPARKPGRKAKPLTPEENAIRAEFLATGQRRPLARKYGITLNRLTWLLDRAPSVVVERERRLAEISKQQNEQAGAEQRPEDC